MSEARRHTPGPWRAGTTNTALVLKDNPDAPGLCDEVAHACRIMPEWEANARLIAAAPELLAECEAVLAVLDEWNMGGTQTALNLAAAIAKATGNPV